jgi:hypothetical protein
MKSRVAQCREQHSAASRVSDDANTHPLRRLSLLPIRLQQQYNVLIGCNAKIKLNVVIAQERGGKEKEAGKRKRRERERGGKEKEVGKRKRRDLCEN